MQPVNEALAALLRTAIRNPRLYAWFQVPVITDATLNSADYAKLGSQLIVDTVTSCRITQILDHGADSINLTMNNPTGAFSPLSQTSPLGKYFYPGAVDNKVALYAGLRNDNTQVETLVPMGVYIIESTAQKSDKESNEMTVTAQDQWFLFNSSTYAEFPPRLFGNQQSSYFNPNYVLTNPSGDGITWVGDTRNWMSQPADGPTYASDYTPISVYVDTTGGSNPAGTQTTKKYVVNYPLGQIIFTDGAIPSNSVVSVDARPLAMAPELMLRHLFCDYGNMDPSFLKFDNSGIVLPVMQIAHERPINDICTDIAAATAPRGIKWRIFFDELGYLNFRELALDAAPTEVLTDTRDILTFDPEFTVRNLSNVIRAQATSLNNQPLTIISYDVTSINIFTEKPIYEIQSQLLSTVNGMDPGSAIVYMSGLTSSALFDLSTPANNATVEVLYNPLRQKGDVIQIIESLTNTNQLFIIDQIDTEIQGSQPQQTLRLTPFKNTQDYQFGISAYVGAALPNQPDQSLGQTSLISSVTIAGTQVVQNGQPVTDSALNALIPTWDGSPLAIEIETAKPPAGSNLYIWRWMYIAEDVYFQTSLGYALCTGDGNSSIFPSNPAGPTLAETLDLSGTLMGLKSAATYGYDFRANNDTNYARRYFWPLLRPSDWLTDDGTTAYTDVHTFDSTWSGGPGYNGTAAQLYGNLRVGFSNYYANATSGYKGQELYAPGTPAANALGASSTAKYGVDFGEPVTLSSGQALVYGIKRAQTPCYLGILVATTAGVYQLKRIPFMLQP
jgi:hypothetical protein